MYFLTLQVVVMHCYLCLYYTTGESVKSYPPFEFRSVPSDIRANTLSFPNSNISPHSNHVTRQQIIHTSAMQSQPVPNVEKPQTKNSDFSFSDFFYAMNGLPEQHNLQPRYGASVNQQNISSFNEYPRRKHHFWISKPFQESASIYVPSTTIEPQPTNKASSKLNLMESVTTKMSSKMSGLMELVFALLGSGSNNLIMKGFKDVVINGIVKPLIVAKGGIKTLISKMSVPFISLLLINFEILVTVWWLWDDCSEPQYLHTDLPPNSYNGNSTLR
ncbi:uncharacterized protein LOC125065865 [Vanessa atalanta]|uniref:uncharacterized protein LOC125065865 n=1 Tax=Vanessa atalanta TaxID=42275 RepID=UPI001FCDA386|nr:uncharacterized protein LOC125065865 [Vanessa atalanta]